MFKVVIFSLLLIGLLNGCSEKKPKDSFDNFPKEKVNLLLNMAKMSRDSGNYEVALEYYDKAYHVDSNELDIYVERAFLLESLGRFEESLGNYKRQLELGYDSLTVFFNQSAIQAINGNLESAMKSYDNAFMIDSLNKAELGQTLKKSDFDYLILNYTILRNSNMLKEAYLILQNSILEESKLLNYKLECLLLMKDHQKFCDLIKKSDNNSEAYKKVIAIYQDEINHCNNGG